MQGLARLTDGKPFSLAQFRCKRRPAAARASLANRTAGSLRKGNNRSRIAAGRAFWVNELFTGHGQVTDHLLSLDEFLYDLPGFIDVMRSSP